jgi:hypothetical protein
MKSIVLNATFLTGSACVVAAAFMLSIPLGLFALGCPLISFSIYAQLKAVAK